MMTKLAKKGSLGLFLCSLLVAGSAVPVGAQALPPQVLALYPVELGELVFIDLQTARRSPHFAQLKEQLLPARFRELERLAAALGVDFDRNVDRLSWGFIDSGDPARSELLGVAEGAFYLAEIEETAAARKLAVRSYRHARVFVLGSNEKKQQFVFAFKDNANCVFGPRERVEAMIDRATSGGPGLLNNATMRKLVEEVNRRTPIWMVLNGSFTHLGVRQLLGEASKMPGVDTLAKRVRSATVRIRLDRGLNANVAAHCATSTDALWFSAFLETALFFQRQRLNNSNPTLARLLADAQLRRAGDRLTLTLTVPESDLVALLRAGSFTLSF